MNNKNKSTKFSWNIVPWAVLISLVLYNLYIGLTIQEIGIPGIFVVKFHQRNNLLPKNINLTGTWTEPGGNIIKIKQTGNHVELSMPYLEAMGIPTTQTGMLEKSPNSKYLGYLKVSNSQMEAELYVSDGGNRLEGVVRNRFQSFESVLIRQ